VIEMRFMIVLHGDESEMEQATPERVQEIVDQMDAYNEELSKAGVFVDGQGLGPSSETRTLRFGDGGEAVVTDGPFAESKEHFAGYWIFEAKDADEAVEWAKKAPLQGGAVEVREMVETAEENAEKFRRQGESR
jgi:hypothetical protein